MALSRCLPMCQFQSTLPHGSDSLNFNTSNARNMFQSTLPHGSDGFGRKFYYTLSGFNPRSLTGATAPIPGRRDILTFQSTLPHGSDGFGRKFYYTLSGFNPRSLTGATAPIPGRRDILTFQSTLPHGSDHNLLRVSLI